MKLMAMAIVAGSLLLPMGVSAADDPGTTQAMFDKLDKNHDGYISQEESKADTDLSMHWTAADKNKDGKLEESEFSAFELDRDIGTTPAQQNP